MSAEISEVNGRFQNSKVFKKLVRFLCHEEHKNVIDWLSRPDLRFVVKYHRINSRNRAIYFPIYNAIDLISSRNYDSSHPDYMKHSKERFRGNMRKLVINGYFIEINKYNLDSCGGRAVEYKIVKVKIPLDIQEEHFKDVFHEIPAQISNGVIPGIIDNTAAALTTFQSPGELTLANALATICGREDVLGHLNTDGSLIDSFRSCVGARYAHNVDDTRRAFTDDGSVTLVNQNGNQATSVFLLPSNVTLVAKTINIFGNVGSITEEIHKDSRNVVINHGLDLGNLMNPCGIPLESEESFSFNVSNTTADMQCDSDDVTNENFSVDGGELMDPFSIPCMSEESFSLNDYLAGIADFENNFIHQDSDPPWEKEKPKVEDDDLQDVRNALMTDMDPLWPPTGDKNFGLMEELDTTDSTI